MICFWLGIEVIAKARKNRNIASMKRRYDMSRAGSAGVSQRRQKGIPSAIVETKIVQRRPTITMGGTLEMKRGRLCLRKGDDLLLLPSGKYRITRCWIPPGRQPWNTDLYSITPHGEAKR